MDRPDGRGQFWLQVLTELKNRGVQDLFFCCVDGLTGFEEAILTVYPQAIVQLCIIHMVRNSQKYVTWKDRKAVAVDLKRIHRSATREEAAAELEVFAEKWDQKYAPISRLWRAQWEAVTPFFAYPEEIRRVLYTTNAIESVNHQLRKALKTRGSLPNDEAAFKLLYLSLRKASQNWTRPVKDWKAALNRFVIDFGERLPQKQPQWV